MHTGIETNFDRTVDIERLDDIESSDKEEYDSHLEDVPCHIQPLDETFSEDITGSFGKDYLMFCASRDILEGDKVIDGATEYRVVGVEKFNFLGAPRHMEVRIRLFQ